MLTTVTFFSLCFVAQVKMKALGDARSEIYMMMICAVYIRRRHTMEIL